MHRLSKSNRSIEEIFPKIPIKTTEKPYFEITDNIHVTVWPEFIDSKSSSIGDLFIWAYHIRIDNKSSEPIKLIKRYWKIIDEKGDLQEVDGEGVVGEQPTILPKKSYNYSSGIHLTCPSGIMTGTYQMKNLTTNELFDIKVPTFSLDTPGLKSVIN